MTSVHPDSNTKVSGGVSSGSDLSDSFSSEPVPTLLVWTKKKTVAEWEVFLFMMAMVLGAQYRQWNISLDEGYWFSFMKLLYVGSNYVCLVLCMAEIASALPFSGGIYGVVRATMGPFAGYTVACFEVLMNISYVAVVVSHIASIPEELFDGNETSEVASIIVVYLMVAIICILGGKIFWTFSGLLGSITVALVLIYLFGSLARTSDHSVDFQGHCDTIPWEYSFVAMITNRAAAASAYRGIQYLPLFSEMLPNPKVQVPRLMVISMLILMVSVISLLTTSCSQYPGPELLSEEKEPLAYGFAAIFGVSWEDGVWLHVPAFIASSFGFIYCAGRQLYKISESTLLPKIFMKKAPYFHTPYMGFIFVAIICGSLSLGGVYNKDLIRIVEEVTVIATAFIYLMNGVSYIYFHYRLSELQRHFHSPLGIYGAIYAIITFGIAIISGIFLKGIDGYVAGGICGLFLVVVWLFYYFYMQKHQHFSEEEREMMFKAYLIRTNRANRKRAAGKRLIPNSKVAPFRSKVSSGGTSRRATSQTEPKSSANRSTSKVELIETESSHKQALVTPAEGVDPERGLSSSRTASRSSGKTASNHPTSPSGPASSSYSHKIKQAVSGKFHQMFASLASVSQEMMEYQQLAIVVSGGLPARDWNEEEDEIEVDGSNNAVKEDTIRRSEEVPARIGSDRLISGVMGVDEERREENSRVDCMVTDEENRSGESKE